VGYWSDLDILFHAWRFVIVRCPESFWGRGIATFDCNGIAPGGDWEGGSSSWHLATPHHIISQVTT
jgi:hypothetical protein